MNPLLAENPSPDEVRFNRDIRPILSENCYSCHGPDKNTRKAKLRLDSRDDIIADHGGVVPVVPGQPEASEVMTRVLSADPEEIMPPPKSGKKLTTQQIEKLRRWIAQGAKFEGHWAFLPPERPILPKVRNSQWPLNPIDHFILDRLEREGLSPAAEADHRTLIRRISFDLSGLPPDPRDVASFDSIPSAHSYKKLVDKLLASSRFGERMAVPWLDLVRYADTVGFHGDNPLSVWPYRDYVINAFNQNLPYDQFTREQLAGDLLPGATRLQKVASGYNRLNRMSTEGGVQDKEYLAKYAADRVRTTSAVWLGATLGCAECHDHKFDPLSTKDFYRMEAFFSDLKERGFYPDGFAKGDWGPKLSLPDASQAARLKVLELSASELKQRMEEITDQDLAAERTEWERAVFTVDKMGELEWKSQKPLRIESSGGSSLELQTNETIVASGLLPDHDDFTVVIPAALPRMTALRLEVLKDENLQGNQLARAGTSFVLGEVVLDYSDGLKTTPVKIRRVEADSAYDGFPASALIDGDVKTGWSQGPLPAKDRRVQLVFDAPLSGGSNFTFTVHLKHNPDYLRQLPARFRLSLTSIPWSGPDKAQMPEDVLKAIRLPGWERKADQEKAVAAFYRRIAPRLQAWRRELDAIENARSMVTGKVPVTLVSEATTPRPMRILPRGNWMDESGETVEPGIPHVFGALTNASGRSTRLDLANWLASRSNPMSARVFVNRLWKMYFGTGLSRTLDDLGSQGEWPTHPELLDWLAIEFIDSGWDIKHMVRLIVTSRTYRQSAIGSNAAQERDPFNRLLARQQRLRLEAEMVRDNALWISGLLVEQPGGPSVRPYQPEGYYVPLNFPKREYVEDTGPGLYRRGLYTHWQRTFLHPSLLAFDAPSREECTVNRTTSNTPLQALVLLNDTTYVEAARAFAEKIVRLGGTQFTPRLAWAFQRVLARAPTAQESQLLAQFYAGQQARFAQDERAAKSLLEVGASPAPVGINTIDLAAWTSVARALLNLHETITRN